MHTRLLYTLAQTQKIVTITYQHGLHTRCIIHLLSQLACDCKRHVLLMRATSSNGTWIITTVPRIDCHHEPAPLFTCRIYRRRHSRRRLISSSWRLHVLHQGNCLLFGGMLAVHAAQINS